MTQRVKQDLAIMFADIAGSTRLYEQLGDAKARALTSDCLGLLSQLTELYMGRVIKTIGDEVMCTFPSADQAADAAVRMQEELDQRADEVDVRLRIRVGFHFGEVILEGGDVFGDAVNLAARMASQAKADQILTTGETVGLINASLQENCRFIIDAQVKGKQKIIEIFELTWGEEEELTILGGLPGQQDVAEQEAVMVLAFGTRELTLGQQRSTISLGRGKQNHFQIPDSRASRMHAKVEYRRGRFVLVDQSTNGTYVMLSGEGGQLVHRDERELSDEGVIGLGRKVAPDDSLAVRFFMR
ncbi:MAG: adenylate/guanylate cyclase domain-containing protein [Magnetococcales bacterium]|nr:adenylate/guanylate cyclase domain-containing protein [Magnetococcales bacterium]